MLRHEREQPIVHWWADVGRGGRQPCAMFPQVLVSVPKACVSSRVERKSYRKGGCFRHLEKRKGSHLPQMPPGSTFAGRGGAVIFFKSGLFMPVWPRHGSWWAIWNVFTSLKLVTLKLFARWFPVICWWNWRLSTDKTPQCCACRPIPQSRPFEGLGSHAQISFQSH